MLAERLTPPWHGPYQEVSKSQEHHSRGEMPFSTDEGSSGGLIVCELRAIAKIVLAKFELERQRESSWQAPQLQVLRVTQFTISQH